MTTSIAQPALPTRANWRLRLHDLLPPRRRKAAIIHLVTLAIVLAFWFLPAALLWRETGDARFSALFEGVSSSNETAMQAKATLEELLATWRLLQTGVIAAVAGFLGLSIMGSRQPLSHWKYREWLATTPWTPIRPLPLGRVGPGWSTLLWLIVLTGLCIQGGINPFAPLVAIAAGMATASIHPANKLGLPWRAFLVAVLLLLALRMSLSTPLRPAAMILALAAGILGWLAVRQAMWRLAYREDLEKQWSAMLLQSPQSLTALARDDALLRISPAPPPRPSTLPQVLAAALLIGLAADTFSAILHVLPIFTDEDAQVISGLAVIGLGFGGAMLRLLFWISGRQPAFSWWLRLRRGRWWMPRSDVLWLAPLSAILTSVGGVLVFFCLIDLPIPEATGVAAALTMLVLLGMGPSRRWYRLCGGGIVQVGHLRTNRSRDEKSEYKDRIGKLMSVSRQRIATIRDPWLLPRHISLQTVTCDGGSDVKFKSS